MAAASALGLVACYLVALGTPGGRRLDASAFGDTLDEATSPHAHAAAGLTQAPVRERGNVVAEEPDRAFVRAHEREEIVHEHGLAAAGESEDDRALSAPEREIHAGEHRPAGKRFAQTFDSYDGIVVHAIIFSSRYTG